MTGNTLYGYQLLRPLGTGGMADIHYAENSLGKPAAVKILKLKYSDEKVVRDRFVSEAKTTVQLHHPNIREVYDLGEIDGRPAMLMEYLEGQSLWEVLKAQGKVDEEKAWDWFRQTVSGLQYAHGRGVIHRDIKPSNLFLTHDGTIKILDFGIAKVKENITMTQTGQTLGTLIYMSPEQVMDPKRVDERTDIYSLGVTYYHLLTGQTPYDITTDSGYVIQKKIVEEELELEELSGGWKERLDICLRKELEERSWEKVMDVNDQPYAKTNHKEEIGNGGGEETVVVKNTAPEKKETKEKNGSSLWSRIRAKTLYISLLILIPLLIWGLWKYLPDFSGDRELIPYYDPDSRLWGVEKGEDIILKPEYHYIHPFSEGMAVVEKSGLFGFVDSLGREVIAVKYDFVDRFSNGRAKIGKDGKFGFIDKGGNEIIPTKYWDVNRFSNGLSAVHLKDKWGFIDKSGKEVIPLKYDNVGNFGEGLAIVTLDGKYGFIDKSGREVIPIIYDWAWDFSEGLAAVEHNNKWGFINRSGNEVVPPKYNWVSDFKDGLAAIYLPEKESYGGKWGFINKNGEITIPIIYNKLHNWDDGSPYFSEGLCVVRLDNKDNRAGFINQEGESIIPFIYDWAWNFSGSLTAVKSAGKWGFINKRGEMIIEPIYDHVSPLTDNLFKVFQEKFAGCINSDGVEIIPPVFDEIGTYSEGLFKVELDGKKGYVDKTGQIVVPIVYVPEMHDKYYDSKGAFSEGLAVVCLKNKFGYIDKSGKQVITIQFDYAHDFRSGIAQVRMGEDRYYINKKGGRVTLKEDTNAKSISQ